MGKVWVLAWTAPVFLAVFLAYNPELRTQLSQQIDQVRSYVTDEILSKVSSPPASGLAVTDDDTCQLKGAIDEYSNCTYQAVSILNQHTLNPILHELVRTAFFRYFKVNVYCDCPLWPDDSMCEMRACSVCECEPSEVPQKWVDAETKSCMKQQPSCDHTTCLAELDSTVNSEVEPTIKSKLLNIKGWRGYNNPWMADGDENEEYLYINLLVNPERYTGYKGEHAHRIWNSIYSQSCFESINCAEKRVFWRLISGTHSSISAHISQHYLLDEDNNVWGQNLTDFEMRLGTPDLRYRVENLYFAYLFVLRAVMKAGPLLEQFEFETGVTDEDLRTQQLVKQLVRMPQLQSACPMPFDEGRLWKGGEEQEDLKVQLQNAFRNITRIMDCVGCEKCKLWGKLQTLGISTALKILFSTADCGQQVNHSGLPELHLERNEVIALLNLLERYSNSLEYYRVMAGMLQQHVGLFSVLSGSEAVA